MVRISSPSDSSSIEFISDYHGRSDLSVSAIYSSSTGDCSQRNGVYVSYPQVSPKSISNLSAFTPTGRVSQCTQSLSYPLYSSSNGDNSQKKEWFVSYPQLSPKSTSHLSTFSVTRGLPRCTRRLSGMSHRMSLRNMSIMSELIEKP